MKSMNKDDLKRKRKNRNVDLLRRMRDGEALQAYDSYSSWYPPRPNVKKDLDAIDRLYKKPRGPKETSRRPLLLLTR